MEKLTPQGQKQINKLARQYGVSQDAVMALLHALLAGQGRMAQFNHPELGGAGQWMPGGMTMVGDMFNHALKAKVEGLCSELFALLANQPQTIQPASHQSQYQGSQSYPNADTTQTSLFVSSTGKSSGQWWPDDLGAPATTGTQNDIRYAYFPAKRRLAIEIDGHITVYDTLDHRIGGVSQQQGTGAASLTFTSQHGLVRVTSLPMVSGKEESQDQPTQTPPSPPPSASTQDVFSQLERLAELKQKGILSEEEFAAKKAELLSRI